jgi:uncharacterized membrane protein YeaQ/YmgE (transglycosylase-associated protein family)
MTLEQLLIWLIVGAIAGLLASALVGRSRIGIAGAIIIGIIGAFFGVWLLTRLGVVPFHGFFGSIVNATIGAVVLLFIVGLVRRVV